MKKESNISFIKTDNLHGTANKLSLQIHNRLTITKNITIKKDFMCYRS